MTERASCDRHAGTAIQIFGEDARGSAGGCILKSSQCSSARPRSGWDRGIEVRGWNRPMQRSDSIDFCKRARIDQREARGRRRGQRRLNSNAPRSRNIQSLPKKHHSHAARSIASKTAPRLTYTRRHITRSHTIGRRRYGSGACAECTQRWASSCCCCCYHRCRSRPRRAGWCRRPPGRGVSSLSGSTPLALALQRIEAAAACRPLCRPAHPQQAPPPRQPTISPPRPPSAPPTTSGNPPWTYSRSPTAVTIAARTATAKAAAARPLCRPWATIASRPGNGPGVVVIVVGMAGRSRRRSSSSRRGASPRRTLWRCGSTGPR